MIKQGRSVENIINKKLEGLNSNQDYATMFFYELEQIDKFLRVYELEMCRDMSNRKIDQKWLKK